jgi:uncharacterized GH25 family protein
MKKIVAHWIVIWTLIGLGSSQTAAHEFWIEPKDFTVPLGVPVVADLKFGTKLKGEIYPYFRSKFIAYTFAIGGRRQDIEGHEGDSPSLRVEAGEPGLAVIAYHSIAERAKFEDWKQVREYLELEGNAWVVDEHKRRGLPDAVFTEAYTRCAKALVEVGASSAGDHDRAVGMPLELVAERNPYAAPAAAELPVRLLWQGKPIEGVQVTVFQNDGALAETRVRTDSEGRVRIPLTGGGMFLLNAVHMQAAPPERGTQWESHWASLTFSIEPQVE